MAGASFYLSGLADRYASALFDLAEDHKAGEMIGRDLRELQAMINDSADLQQLLKSPLLSRTEQAAALGALLKKAKFVDLTKRFITVVAQNRRLFALPQMITRYFALVSEARGEVVAEVVSAEELTGEQSKSIAAALKKAAGGDVQIVPRVDPNLLGGLVVKLGSRMFDSSLSAKLANLKLVMKGMA